MADTNTDTDNENAVDDDAVAAEWAAMAEADGGGGGNGGEDGNDDDAVAAEWAAMAEDEAGDADSEATSNQPTRVLNQDEIDSLLGFDDQNDGAGKTGMNALFNSTMVSYERLPMLEVVFDRVVRLLTTSLRNFTSDNVEVTIDGMVSVRFGDYLNSIPLPAMLAGLRATTLFFLEQPDFLKLRLHGGFTWGAEASAAGSRGRTEAWRAALELLRGACQRCIEVKVFVDRDPDLIARMVVSMQQVELAHWLDGGMKDDPEQVATDLEEHVERAFRRATSRVSRTSPSPRSRSRRR